MDEFIIAAALMKLGYVALAAACIWYGLRALDRSLGASFRETVAIIRQQPIATAIYYGARILAVCLLVGLVIGCAPARAGTFSDRYDRDIKRAVETYWPAYPYWTAWKAQLFQESRLDPAAVSPVGAAGLAQFMPGTWAEVARQLRLPPGLSPHHDIAIQAGAWYMAKLRHQWSAPRPEDDRHRLAQASYNAGLGHLLAAQRRCGAPSLYLDIIRCLPQITGRHSEETITYVQRIARWRAMMGAGL